MSNIKALWDRELEKLHKAMDRAIEDNDYQKQEELSREMLELKNSINYVEEE